MDPSDKTAPYLNDSSERPLDIDRIKALPTKIQRHILSFIQPKYDLMHTILTHKEHLLISHNYSRWVPGGSLNTIESVIDKDLLRFFRIQCWLEPYQHLYSCFRIEDDISHSQFILHNPLNTVKKSKNHEITNFFFDGPNDNNFFITGFNYRTKNDKEGSDTTCNYAYFVNSLYPKQKQEVFPPDQNVMVTENAKLMALALHKTTNRYVIASDKTTKVFEVDMNSSTKEPRLLAQADSTAPFIKTIYFLTPQTLIMLHRNNALYILFFNTDNGTLFAKRQVIRGAVQGIRNIAPDQSNPHHIAVQDRENNLFLVNFNLSDGNHQQLIKIASAIPTQYMWLSTNNWSQETQTGLPSKTLCLGTHKAINRAVNNFKINKYYLGFNQSLQPIVVSPPLQKDKTGQKDNHKDTSENDGNSTRENSLSTSNSQIINQVKLAQLKRSLIQKKIFPLRRPILIKLNTFARSKDWWPPWPTEDASPAILKNVINASLRSFESLHSDFYTNPYQRINQF